MTEVKPANEVAATAPPVDKDASPRGSYANNNHPPLSKWELRAWYLYDWGSSAYAVIAISIFMPVYLVDIAMVEAGCDIEEDECDKYVTLAGSRIRPSAFAFNCITISVAVQAVFFITMSSFADFGAYRKKFLLLFTTIGAAATSLYIVLVDSSLWWLAGLLTIVSNVLYGVSFVFYNAYLPLLVQVHPNVVEASPDTKLKVEEDTSNDISLRGVGIGGVGAVTLMLVCVAILLVESSMLGMRICVFLTGLWWFAFTIPFHLFVHTRPGPELPSNANYLTFGWIRVYKTIKDARELPHTYKYLAAFTLFSDGYNTIGSVGVLFGSLELGLSERGLIIVAIIVPLMGFLGNSFYIRLQRRYQLKSMTMLKINLYSMLFLPTYAMFGFFAPFGLVSIGEFFGYAVIYGFNLGSAQSFSRTLFADLIPSGKEAEFFGLYGITDKGSSWIGPLLIGIILQQTNSMRWGLGLMIFFFVIPLSILHFVDMDEGRDQARKYKTYEMSVQSAAAPGTPGTGPKKQFLIDVQRKEEA